MSQGSFLFPLSLVGRGKSEGDPFTRPYDLYHVDAFTETPLSGNAAAVVPDARGLSEQEMQAIAREMNLSETAFVFPPEAGDHDLLVRFFASACEVPLCGHATVALHHVRVAELGFPAGRVVQKTKAGLIPVKVATENGILRVVFTMQAIPFGRVLGREERLRVLAALGLAPEGWDGRCPMQHVGAGVMVGVSSRAALDALAPDATALAALTRELGLDDVVPFTLEPVDPAILVHVRVFAPAMGIAEDPVTGSANGPLAAYLVKHRLVEWTGDELRFRSRQGEAIGRPGTVHLRVKIENGEPVSVDVAGTAVTFYKTHIHL